MKTDWSTLVIAAILILGLSALVNTMYGDGSYTPQMVVIDGESHIACHGGVVVKGDSQHGYDVTYTDWGGKHALYGARKVFVSELTKGFVEHLDGSGCN